MLPAMRTLLLLLLLPVPALAQGFPLGRADSALVAGVLVAEDTRQADDPALQKALKHGDVRIRTIAARAIGRIEDSLFAGRDSLPPPRPAPVWPEPAWRLRLRALTPTTECAAVKPALADSAWPVRLRAAAVAGMQCSGDADVIAILQGWIDPLPKNVSKRARGGVSWHAAAAALPALARLEPTTARAALPRFATHEAWPLRRAAVRAAAVLADTTWLASLAGDPSGNVQEAAVEALARIAGHAEDSVYMAVLRDIRRPHPQAARAAGDALHGSPREQAPYDARKAFEFWNRRAIDSERDVRRTLLAASGGSAEEERPLNPRPPIPTEAVALALGADVRLRVTMQASSGGGSFVVRLRGDVAPIMAARILALARKGYYDGLTWHRVEHDFVIQGGSPGDNEYVGYETYLRDELGPLDHPRGTVGMSTRGHDSGDAQWFVNLRDNPRLRRDYTVFAEVVEGIDVVDGIMELDRIERIEVVDRAD
jgi:cyclophilin family peptidyl-prolyl cis-trans isomerase/HEAT repeat protein